MSRYGLVLFAFVVFGITACAPTPEVMRPSAEAVDIIDLRLSYPDAFDRVIRTLEREGYEVETADERVGLIRTLPKTKQGADGVSYKTAVVVRMGGTDRESWLAVDHVAIPTFPEDEQRLEDALKGLER